MKRKPPSPLFDVPPGVALPHSEESERAVLGAVLLQPELIDKVAARLQVSDFYLEAHRLLFAAMSRLHRAGTVIDLRTLQAELEQRQTFEAAGGLSYLATLDLDLPDIGRIDAYLDIVAERSARRALIELGGAAIRESLIGSVDAASILARLQQEIPSLLQSAVRTRLRPAAEIVPSRPSSEFPKRPPANTSEPSEKPARSATQLALGRSLPAAATAAAVAPQTRSTTTPSPPLGARRRASPPLPTSFT